MEIIKIYSLEFFKLDSNDQKRLRIFLALVSIIKLAQSNLWGMENYASVQLIPNLIQPVTCLVILYFSIFIKRSPAFFFLFITVFFWTVLFLDGTLLLYNLKTQQILDFEPFLRVIILGIVLFFSKTILKYSRSVVSEMKRTKEFGS